MLVNTYQEENYLHLSIEGKFDEDSWDEVTTLISDEDNQQIWIVMEFETPELSLHADMVNAIAELNEYCLENKGLLILLGSNEKMDKISEITRTLILPTLDESIDYIFMEQLEQDLGLDE